jgi:uracil-DNA glycosylase
MNAADRTPADDLALLAWLVELGADEAICEEPIDRFAASAERTEPAPRLPRTAQPSTAPAIPRAPAPDPDGIDTRALAAGCPSLEELRAALESFEGCALKKGARNTVFADGRPGARVMIVGEAPGRDEDITGLPFVGRSGQLLDRMFAAIGLSRSAESHADAVYITNVLPWRPLQNREPSADEMAMLMPFLRRHVALAAPEILILMGNAATRSLLETTTGITRLRGTWTTCEGLPALPMFHPAALLRDPEKKRLAWADLLEVRARLSG